MIYDTLANIEQYSGLHPDLALALHFLAESNFSELEDGCYKLRGDDVFANISTDFTREKNETPETHRMYIDVQYLISGRELVGVAPAETMTGVAQAHPERDIWFNYGAVEQLTLGDGRFLVLWPGDAHAPSVAYGAPSQVRKCVVKVRVPQ